MNFVGSVEIVERELEPFITSIDIVPTFSRIAENFYAYSHLVTGKSIRLSGCVP